MKVYLVGGAVRDRLLNYPVRERDWVVVGATPEILLAQGYRPVGKDFPVFLHPQSNEEYALARTERKSGRGYQGFQFCTDPGITLEEDLSRRDLTINAMAMDGDGNLIDPYGGQRDLQQRVLRHVSAAFAEDPLRVLRVARFAARYAHLGFTIAPETLTLMTELTSSDELQYLSAERVWVETERALAEQSPRTYIDVLRECGALKALFPEVDCLFGVPQRADYHPEIDTGLHVLMALDQAAILSDDSAVRFAVLVHDLGKGVTPSDILPRHIGHEASGVKLVNQLCDRLRVPNRFRELAVAVTRHHLNCHRAPHLKATTTLRLLQEIGALRDPEKLTRFIHCCEADAKGRLGFEQRPYPPGEWLRRACDAVREVSAGEFLQQGLSGKQLGQAIEQRQLAILNNLREPCHK
jgi:tRNA nucleotidyltransferase (CCA-adding enzyme)